MGNELLTGKLVTSASPAGQHKGLPPSPNLDAPHKEYLQLLPNPLHAQIRGHLNDLFVFLKFFPFLASWWDYYPLQQYVGRPAKSPVSQPPCPLLPLYALPLSLQTDESRPDRLVPDDSNPGNSFGHRPP